MFILLTSLFLCFGEIIANGEAGHNNEEIGMEKRMLSYADLMNNFGGPSALDLAGQGLLIDDERPKREQNYNNDDVHIMTLWKRSPSYGPSFFNTAGDLTKKDDFIAPGVLRFGKRMPGVLRFGKRDRVVIQEKKAVPGVLRFGKRQSQESGAVPGVLRFGKRMPQVLRFGK
nr:FMRFamide-related peptide FLP-18 precursor [Meloidogyne incognita]